MKVTFNQEKIKVVNLDALQRSEESDSECHSDNDSIEAKRKNKLVRSISTRCGRWVDRDLQGLEFNKLRVYSRDYYNKHRHLALAMGKIHEDDNIMNANEAHLI